MPGTALYHVGRRELSVGLGRFVTVDPIAVGDRPGAGRGSDVYSYADDRPTVLVDPAGTSPRALQACLDASQIPHSGHVWVDSATFWARGTGNRVPVKQTMDLRWIYGATAGSSVSCTISFRDVYDCTGRGNHAKWWVRTSALVLGQFPNVSLRPWFYITESPTPVNQTGPTSLKPTDWLAQATGPWIWPAGSAARSGKFIQYTAALDPTRPFGHGLGSVSNIRCRGQRIWRSCIVHVPVNGSRRREEWRRVGEQWVAQ